MNARAVSFAQQMHRSPLTSTYRHLSVAAGGHSSQRRRTMASAAASPNVVTPEWLEENLDNPDVKVLDSSWFLPTMGRSNIEEFKASRIPGSQFFDIDGVANVSSTPFPHMTPSPSALAAAADVLGITERTHVVFYDRVGTFSCARAWWVWKAHGHDKASLLSGGFPAWQSQGRPIDTAPASDEALSAPKAAAQSPPAALKYPVRGETSLVRSIADVKAALASGSAQVLDARSAGRFRGLDPEPRADVTPGHMAGAVNVPFTDLLEGSSPAGRFQSPDELRKVLENAGVDLAKPIICSCGSGATAAILAHALVQVGTDLVPIYDGSWMEWALGGNEIISEADSGK